MPGFFESRTEEQKRQYLTFLQKFGELSGLFSDSKSPYLYYRIHENLFCKVFDAENLSRGDISYDAKSGSLGIGLKTFLHNNGRTFQKVAEFNKDSHLFRNLSDKSNEEKVRIVAELRNKRLDFAKKSTNCSEQIYHLITRRDGEMLIFECEMNYINIPNISIISETDNTIRFTDSVNEYSLSLSKSTLLQRFNTAEPVAIIPVNISADPFSIIIGLEQRGDLSEVSLSSESANQEIFLPLYSERSGQVQEKSALNQWNAGGRDRHQDEVYIPVPAKIHRLFAGFFPFDPNTPDGSAKDSPHFEVLLPNGERLDCKITQQGGKGFASSPNKALGKWLLRDVLGLPKGEILTKDLLDEIGIDSVRITKLAYLEYRLDFAATGSYHDFIERAEESSVDQNLSQSTSRHSG